MKNRAARKIAVEMWDWGRGDANELSVDIWTEGFKESESRRTKSESTNPNNQAFKRAVIFMAEQIGLKVVDEEKADRADRILDLTEKLTDRVSKLVDSVQKDLDERHADDVEDHYWRLQD